MLVKAPVLDPFDTRRIKKAAARRRATKDEAGSFTVDRKIRCRSTGGIEGRNTGSSVPIGRLFKPVIEVRVRTASRRVGAPRSSSMKCTPARAWRSKEASAPPNDKPQRLPKGPPGVVNGGGAVPLRDRSPKICAPTVEFRSGRQRRRGAGTDPVPGPGTPESRTRSRCPIQRAPGRAATMIACQNERHASSEATTWSASRWISQKSPVKRLEFEFGLVATIILAGAGRFSFHGKVG